jgi:hypothetical protein
MDCDWVNYEIFIKKWETKLRNIVIEIKYEWTDTSRGFFYEYLKSDDLNLKFIVDNMYLFIKSYFYDKQISSLNAVYNNKCNYCARAWLLESNP